jgi:ATP-binding cassette, subfamily C, bacterial CydC
MIMAFLLSYMVGSLLSGKREHLSGPLLPVLLVLVVLRAGLSYLDTWMSHDIAYRILAKLRIKLYHQIEALSPAFLQDNRSGRIVSIALEDVEILEWFYAHTLGTAIITVLITVMAGAFLAFLHPLIAMVMLPFVAFAAFIPSMFKEKSDASGNAVRKHVAELGAEMVDGVNGIKDILSLNWQKHFMLRFKKACDTYEHSRLVDGKRRAYERVTVLLTVGLAVFATLLTSAFLVRGGRLSGEWFPVAVTLSGAVFTPLMAFLALSTQFGVIFAAAGRVFNILSAEPNVRDTGAVKLSPNGPLSLRFEKVGFTYPGESTSAVSAVSFDAREGETIALAGASGSGKSTLANLLQRYWEFDRGDILINGRSIREYTLESLRAQIAVVPQEVYLFNTSIVENLRISAPTATDEDIQNAAKAAVAHAFILALPNGYDTVVGERGARLSGGQRQRIAITRALLKDSRILVLDEASSSLDSENENRLNAALNLLKKNRCTIVIAHRLSTLRNADRVVFLNEGRLVDIGKFDELMMRCPLFAETAGIDGEGESQHNENQ